MISSSLKFSALMHVEIFSHFTDLWFSYMFSLEVERIIQQASLVLTIFDKSILIHFLKQGSWGSAYRNS